MRKIGKCEKMMENVLKKEGKSLFMGEENVLKRKNRKRKRKES